MAKYVLLIGDGNAAASRGTEGETLYTFHATADSVDEAIDICEEDIRSIDRFDYYDDYLEEAEDEGEEPIPYHEYFNGKDPSGGDIWLVAYLEDGKLVDCYDLELLKSGEDNAYEFDNYDDAELFGMEPYVEDKRWGIDESLIKSTIREALIAKSHLKESKEDLSHMAELLAYFNFNDPSYYKSKTMDEMWNDFISNNEEYKKEDMKAKKMFSTLMSNLMTRGYMLDEECDYVECLNENLDSLKQELESGDWINIDCGLLPYDYGYDSADGLSGYEDLAVDVKKADDKYNVYFYLETESGPVEEPDESDPTYSFDTFEELERFIKNGYRE